MRIILFFILGSAHLFAQDYDKVEQILQNKCVSCHSAENSHSRIFLDNYDSVMENVIPGSPNESDLWISIASGMMPMEDNLSQEEKETIRIWIEDGAKKTP